MNKGRHIGKWMKDCGLPKVRHRSLGRGMAEFARERRLIRKRKMEKWFARHERRRG